MAHEVGISVEADFNENTWTFRMVGDYSVAAGEHAIEPLEVYTARLIRLERAEKLLRRLEETQNEHTMGLQCYEAVMSFFDPSPQ